MKFRSVSPVAKIHDKFWRALLIGVWPALLLCVSPHSSSHSVAPRDASPELVIQTGHNSRVNCAAFSPDRRWLASGGADNTVRLWDVESGSELRALLGHTNWIKSLAISHKGDKLASGSNDRTIRIWEAASGRELLKLIGHDGPVEALAFSPDDRWLVSGSADATIRVWDVSTGRELQKLTGHEGAISSLAFSRDGKTLASGGVDKTVRLWETMNWAASKSLNKHTKRITTLSFSPNGERLASGSADGVIQLWDVRSGKDRSVLKGSGSPVLAAEFVAENELISTSSDGTVALWDTDKGKEKRTTAAVVGVEENIFAAISSEGGLVASSPGNRSVDLRSAATGKTLRRLESHSTSFYSVAFSADGRWLASGANDRTIRIWQMATGRELPKLSGHTGWVRAIAFSPDSRLLASGSNSGEVKLWDVNAGREVFSVPFMQEQIHTVAFSPDGKWLAVGGTGAAVHLLDITTRAVRNLTGHTGEITSIAFRPGSTVLASGSTDKTVRLWDTSTGRELKTLTTLADQVNAIAFNPDGSLLAVGSAGSKVTLINPESGESKMLSGHNGEIQSLAFSPDGKLLASGGADETIKLWDPVGGREVRTLKSDSGEVFTLAFSNNSRWLVSGNAAGTMMVWRAETGELAANVISVPGRDDWLVATPDGLFDGSQAAWKFLLWRFAQNTFQSAPVESFFNEFYYPGLLADIFAAKKPEAAQDIVTKDRRQPDVKVEPADAMDASGKFANRTVRLKLEVSEAPAGGDYAKGSGARDLRLFRNGLLVQAWSGDVLGGRSTQTIETTVPVVAGENRFTAYAFNRDNVKSKDFLLAIDGADALRRTGTAYLIVAGVGQYANPQYNLNYSVADANAIGEQLKSQQELLNRYRPIEVVSLLNKDATKANILLALDLLAGNFKGQLSQDSPADLRKIKKAQPEDAVVFYFSGHGTAADDRFYLIPHDLGYAGSRTRLDKIGLDSILSHSISDLELETALKDVDVDQLLLIIDACNSGQALNAEDQRRGPMNVRGLAQLAYEKGMYVLTASQSDEVAFESAGLKHSYLAYALVEEGIKSSAADADRNGQVLLKEWFDYATERVPRIGKEKVRAGKQLEEVDPDEQRVQRPRVFNMREGGAERFVIARLAGIGLNK